MKLSKDILKYVVEFLGTLFFISAILLSKGNAFVIGAALAVAILLGGKVSGGHFDPFLGVNLAGK